MGSPTALMSPVMRGPSLSRYTCVTHQSDVMQGCNLCPLSCLAVGFDWFCFGRLEQVEEMLLILSPTNF